MRRGISLLMGLVVSSFLSLAQDNAGAHAPDGNTWERVVSIYIPPLTNAPFSGVLDTELTKKLEDGTTITMKNHRVIMRDSAGRIYQERRWFLPPSATQDPAITRIEISDPIRHQKYFCNPNYKNCRPFLYNAPPVSEAATPNPPAGGPVSIQRLDLGKNVLNGVDVVGTRETMTINAGVMGNDRPIDVTKEFWYSPKLGVNVSVKRVDPRYGVQTFTLRDISLTEPDPKSFNVPEGYRLLEKSKAAAPPDESEQ